MAEKTELCETHGLKHQKIEFKIKYLNDKYYYQNIILKEKTSLRHILLLLKTQL